jgi:lipopolysaccharide transport system permease protein
VKNFIATPLEMISTVVRNRELIVQMAKREVLGRYRGSILGLLWSFFNPLFMLAVYTLVFSVVFKARWGLETESKATFSLILFCGLIIFNLFADCINRAPTLILSNANFVKKVVFPLEILPWVIFFSALFHATISWTVWLLFYLVIFGIPKITFILFPFVLAPLMFLILGLSWFLASLGVFLRDIGQLTSIVVTSLLFLTPILYPLSAVPEKLRIFINLNPLTMITETGRNVLIMGTAPDLFVFSLFTFWTVISAWVGFAWFQKTRKGFADVL